MEDATELTTGFTSFLPCRHYELQLNDGSWYALNEEIVEALDETVLFQNDRYNILPSERSTIAFDDLF